MCTLTLLYTSCVLHCNLGYDDHTGTTPLEIRTFVSRLFHKCSFCHNHSLKSPIWPQTMELGFDSTKKIPHILSFMRSRLQKCVSLFISMRQITNGYIDMTSTHLKEFNIDTLVSKFETKIGHPFSFLAETDNVLFLRSKIHLNPSTYFLFYLAFKNYNLHRNHTGASERHPREVQRFLGPAPSPRDRPMP